MMQSQGTLIVCTCVTYAASVWGHLVRSHKKRHQSLLDHSFRWIVKDPTRPPTRPTLLSAIYLESDLASCKTHPNPYPIGHTSRSPRQEPILEARHSVPSRASGLTSVTCSSILLGDIKKGPPDHKCNLRSAQNRY